MVKNLLNLMVENENEIINVIHKEEIALQVIKQ